MTLADLFDNRLWETYEVDAAPKRGGTVERRRYIGKNPMTMEFTGVDYGGNSDATVAASTPTNEKESSIFGGLFAPKDVLGISPFSGPFESGKQYVGSDNVYRKGGMSYDVADPSRHHARFNPGGHTTTLRPVGTSEWGLGTLYNDAGETQARRLAAKPDLTDIEPTPEDSNWFSDKFNDAKEWGSGALDYVGGFVPQSVKDTYDYVNNPPATVLSDKAEEARLAGEAIIPSTYFGTADRAIIDQNIRNISEQFVSDRIKEEYAQERARYQELIDQGVDKVTAAIMAGREFKRATGQTLEERSPDQKKAAETSEKFDLLRFLQGLGSAYLGKRL